jgi:hypothetical protein
MSRGSWRDGVIVGGGDRTVADDHRPDQHLPASRPVRPQQKRPASMLIGFSNVAT